MEGVETMTHSGFLSSFLEDRQGKSVQQKLSDQFMLAPASQEISYLNWSGFFNDEPVGLTKGTPAQILEHILNKKWRLNASDKDQIVMWHRFVYEMNGSKKELQSSLVATGTDAVNTAMAKTVGLPLAITAKLLTQQKISSRGIVIPTTREFYEPILSELCGFGVIFNEAHA